PPSIIYPLPLHDYPAPRHLHSFPTRRSSDLPDYMALDGSNPQAGEYPIGLYKELLHYARSRYAGQYWAALPRQVAAYLLKSMALDRKSTRLNSSHVSISYAVFCLKKKKKIKI